MFVFLLWYVQLSLPSPKSKSRSVFNQNGFNGKNETTHCSNKKSAWNSCNLPFQPPTLFSYILLLLRKPWNTTIENRTNLYLTEWYFSVKMKETLWKKQIINSIFTKPSKHYVFSLAQPLVFSFLLIHFCYFTKRASSVKKETNLRMGNFFRH